MATPHSAVLHIRLKKLIRKAGLGQALAQSIRGMELDQEQMNRVMIALLKKNGVSL